MRGKWVLFCTVVVALCGLAPQTLRAAMPSTGLRVWLKADAITNLADGGSVSNWPDSSGLGYDATNKVGTNQPIFILNGLNGKPVVSFDGTNDYLARDNYSHGGSDNGVMYIVTKRTGTPTGYHNILIQGPSSFISGGAQFWQIYADSNHRFIGNFASDGLDCTTTVYYATAGYQILELRKDNVAGTSAFYVNGSNCVSRTGTTQSIGTRYYLGGWAAGNRTSGSIAEVLIYNVAQSDSDRQLVEGLLAWKYALTTSLPADHPWKSRNPEAISVPSIDNRPPDTITAASATLNSYLVSTGDSPCTVSVVWGETNGGSAFSGQWAFTNTFATGLWAAGSYPATNVTFPVTNRFYSYRYRAVNVTDSNAAGASLSFLAGDVWVTTTTPSITEGGATNLFTIHRPAGATNLDSTINLVIGGTANYGQDYLLSPAVTTNISLPAGADSTNIVIQATSDRIVESAETITLTLLPGLYSLGSASNSTVTIQASTNIPGTAAYWRFEGAFSAVNNTTGFLSDSSGNQHHMRINSGSYNSGSQVSIPYVDGTTNRGASFPNPIPQNGLANGKGFWVTYGGWLDAGDAEDWNAEAFTVELFMYPTYVDTKAAAIVSQWSSPNQRSWFLGRPTTSSRLGIILSANGSSSATFSGPTLDWDLKLSNDYYTAFSFDRSRTNGGVILYFKNLTTNGPLMKAVFDHNLPSGLFNSSAGLIVDGMNGGGGADTGSEGVRGLFDELRVSIGALSERQLLINRASSGGSLILIR